MSVDHYFTQARKDTKDFFITKGTIDNQSFKLYSADGLFSARGFDLGTRILLKYYQPGSQAIHRLLDLGCGYGLVASFLAAQYMDKKWQQMEQFTIDACDISPLACQVTEYNLASYKHPKLQTTVKESDILADNYFVGKQYQSIITNPPFSAGKKVVKEVIKQGYDHLSPDGVMRIVIPTKKGAKSYLERCRTEFGPASVTIQALEAGYRVRTLEKIAISSDNI